jgi:hypothetical protein
MTIDYARPPRPRSGHDHVFTGLALGLVFLLVVMCTSLFSMTRNPALPPESKWVFHMSAALALCYAAIVVLSMILRWAFPASRRVFTIALSVALLVYVPFGTALRIYGLLKVDRTPPEDLPPPPGASHGPVP